MPGRSKAVLPSRLLFRHRVPISVSCLVKRFDSSTRGHRSSGRPDRRHRRADVGRAVHRQPLPSTPATPTRPREGFAQGGCRGECRGESHDPEDLPDAGLGADERQASAPLPDPSTSPAQQRQAEAVQELDGAEIDHDQGGRAVRRRVQYRSDVHGGGYVDLPVEFDNRVSTRSIDADGSEWRRSGGGCGVPGHDGITVRSVGCPPRTSVAGDDRGPRPPGARATKLVRRSYAGGAAHEARNGSGRTPSTLLDCPRRKSLTFPAGS